VTIEPGPRGGEIRAFEGVSEYNDESSAASLHQAIQNAAKEAADKGATGDYEVTRIQIVVGNPNVKVYRAEITQT
jgi:hypothetical protein